MVTDKVRLAFYMYSPAIGGAERYLRDLLWALNRDRYEVTLFYEPWPALEQFLDLDAAPPLHRYPVEVREVSMAARDLSHPLPRKLITCRLLHRTGRLFNPYRWTLSNYRRLQSALASTPIDVLHIHNGGYPGASTAQLASIAANAVGIPACVMSVASMPLYLRFPRFIERRFDHRVENTVDRFVVVAQGIGRALEQWRGFRAEKIRPIYCGVARPQIELAQVEMTALRCRLGLSSTSIVIGMVARLFPGKGHDCLLQALAQIGGENLFGKVQVLLVGGGPLLSQLQAYTLELGLKSLVRIAGRLPEHSDVLRAMLACDIITLPSEMEGLPYVITEAMSLAKPVVASSIGGIPEQIVEGETGLLVPPRDPSALAKAIWLLINDSAMRQQMGINARARYEAKFTLERMLEEHETLYQTLCGDEAS